MAAGRRLQADVASLDGLPEKLRHIVERCVAPDPENRWHAAADVKALLEWASEPEKKRKGRSRKPVLTLAGALGLLALTYFAYRYFAPASPNSSPTFTQITDLPGVEDFPSLSPDGKTVAYRKLSPDRGADIYVQRIGGNPINLTEDLGSGGADPAFSPDGDQIAFVSAGRADPSHRGLFVMGSTGESVRRVGDACSNPSWSPDAKEIVCSTQGTRPDRPEHVTIGQLWRVDVATGQHRVISGADAVHPDWSPHGKRIAYTGTVDGKTGVFTIPAEGGDPISIAHDASRDWNPKWAPDGQHLYFISDRGGRSNLWRAEVDEASGRVAGSPEAMTAGAAIATPTISRNGRHIAYAQASEEANIYKVAFDPSAGSLVGEPQQITRGSTLHERLAVSPDGKWLAYNTGEPPEHIFVMRSDGSGIRQLTNDTFRSISPVWSPDGRRIAFLSMRSAQWEIWLMNADGGGLEQLTHTEGTGEAVSQPGDWSPGGKKFLFLTTAKEPRVMSVGAGPGGQEPEPLPPTGRQEPLAFARWSPDGEKIALGFGGTTVPLLYSIRTHTYTALAPLPSPNEFVTAWLSDSRRAITRSLSGIGFIDTATGRRSQLFAVSANLLTSLTLSPDNRTIYFTRSVNEADIWMMAFN
jgi:Tol biopolymer transport system component